MSVASNLENTFLSTLSLRRATIRATVLEEVTLYFYPRSPCGERPYYMQWDITDTVISIHALLAESDARTMNVLSGLKHFYPRSPCGERRILVFCGPQGSGFLSTLSLRRATDKRCQFNGDNGFLSTLSLRRATFIAPLIFSVQPRFLSTLSLRRATIRVCQIIPIIQISIHALLAESDHQPRPTRPCKK